MDINDLFRNYVDNDLLLGVTRSNDTPLPYAVPSAPTATPTLDQAIPPKESGLYNFIKSMGYGMVDKPVDVGSPNAGWQTYLGAKLGSQLGSGILNSVLFGGEAGNRAAMSAKPTLYNTPEEIANEQRSLDTFVKKYQSKTAQTKLSAEDQVKARTLARRLYGVRGAEMGLPGIYRMMEAGDTIDQIEDKLRFAGQSAQFVGTMRDAAQTILMGAPEKTAQTSMDYIDDLVTRGDTEGAKQQMKRLVLKQAGVDDQRTVVGKERTIKLLEEIQGDLNRFEALGGNTNIFTGKAEEVAKKVGTVVNPEARKIATKIAAAVQNYRRSMTGVQFGMPENLEYKAMFPSIERTANFNTATIAGLREVMQGDLDNFYGMAMGENNYNELFKKDMTKQVGAPRLSNDEAYKLYLQKRGGK